MTSKRITRNTITGTLVTRNQDGTLGAYTMSGFDWQSFCRELASRGRHTTLVHFAGFEMTSDEKYCHPMQYLGSELTEFALAAAAAK